MRFREQVRALAIDHRVSGANFGAGRLRLRLAYQVVAQLALHNLRIDLVPFELGDIEGASDLAVAATNAEIRGPSHDPQSFLVQRLHGATRNAGGINAVHALLLDEGALLAVVRHV